LEFHLNVWNVAGRVTYVTDRNGEIKMIFDSMMATKHIPKALEAIKSNKYK
jgi:peroxiredoxin